MTYMEFIESILASRPRFLEDYDGYKERHHIVMKSLGGTNEEDNLIDLIGSEHYEAHKLLAKENPDCKEAQYAWLMMSTRKDAMGRTYDVSAEDWAELKKNISGRLNPNFGHKMSEEQKRKISESKRGTFPTEEHRKKLSKAQTGKKHSEESKLKRSQKLGTPTYCDGVWYPSVSLCAKHYGVNPNTMNGWITGHMKMPEKFVKMGLTKKTIKKEKCYYG